jgi:hypothetical protein
VFPEGEISSKPLIFGMLLRISVLPETRIMIFKMIRRNKMIVVSGNAQNKSLSALKKSFTNHKSIENTAFKIYTKKLITVFAAIDISEIIDRILFPQTKKP